MDVIIIYKNGESELLTQAERDAKAPTLNNLVFRGDDQKQDAYPKVGGGFIVKNDVNWPVQREISDAEQAAADAAAEAQAIADARIAKYASIQAPYTYPATGAVYGMTPDRQAVYTSTKLMLDAGYITSTVLLDAQGNDSFFDDAAELGAFLTAVLTEMQTRLATANTALKA